MGNAYRVYNPPALDFSRYDKFDVRLDYTGQTKRYLFQLICRTGKEIRILRAAIAWILPDSFLFLLSTILSCI